MSATDPRPDPEQRYTLEEAKRILDIRECTRKGHVLEVLLTNGGIPTTVVCTRCPGRWGVTQSS